MARISSALGRPQAGGQLIAAPVSPGDSACRSRARPCGAPARRREKRADWCAPPAGRDARRVDAGAPPARRDGQSIDAGRPRHAAVLNALTLLKKFTGRAYYDREGNHKKITEEELIAIGGRLLEKKDPIIEELDIYATGFENSQRRVKINKALQAYHLYKELVKYHALQQLLEHIQQNKISSLDKLSDSLPARMALSNWVNVGGQLILRTEIDKLIKQVQSGRVKSWDEIHAFYQAQAKQYATDKLVHALAALKEVYGINFKKASPALIKELLLESVSTREWMVKAIRESRAKDYENPFRKMVYETEAEMEKVVGKLSENAFIKQEQKALEAYKKDIGHLIKKLKIGSLRVAL